ncbi:MAG: hypothetical protein ACRCZI_02100 [Cetobacterium sp.]
MAAILKMDEKISANVTFKDAKGNLAPVDGVPEWSVSNPTVVAMTVAPDGMSAEFMPIAVGETQVSVRADARLGPSVVEIVGLGDLSVIASEATTVEVTFGAAVPQAPPTP